MHMCLYMWFCLCRPINTCILRLICRHYVCICVPNEATGIAEVAAAAVATTHGHIFAPTKQSDSQQANNNQLGSDEVNSLLLNS